MLLDPRLREGNEKKFIMKMNKCKKLSCTIQSRARFVMLDLVKGGETQTHRHARSGQTS